MYRTPTIDTLERMDQHIANWVSSDDQRKTFLQCYRAMTANMADAINDNKFEDNAWVNLLLNRFAEYYFDALACYECASNTPKVWYEVHKDTGTTSLHPIQHLLLGVNAHINYDLVLALYDILWPEWPTANNELRAKRYRDHCKVNQVIAATIDQVQDEIIEPGRPAMALIDTLLGRMDELLISHLIASWRDDVWEHAVQMLNTTSESGRETLRVKIESDVMNTANKISLQNIF